RPQPSLDARRGRHSGHAAPPSDPPSATAARGPASSKPGTRALATTTSPWRQSGVLARSLTQTYPRARMHHFASRALRRRGAPAIPPFHASGWARRVHEELIRRIPAPKGRQKPSLSPRSSGHTANCDAYPVLSDFGMQPLSVTEYGGTVSW